MVATTTADHRHHWRPMRGRTVRRRDGDTGVLSNVGHLGLGTVSVLVIVVSAWGGIIPFLGPSFGYGGDGAGSWHWSLTHVVMALVPGAIGVLVGMMVLGRSRGMVVGRGRIGLATAGLLVIACGAWLAIAPWAWPVVNNQHAYFVPATPLRFLAYVAGYAVGPGLIVASCGAYFLGWASRHQNAGTTIVHDMHSEPLAAPPPAAPLPPAAPVET